jgi:hypothetical protein
LSGGCTSGAEYRFEPPDAFTVERVALAADRRPIALRLVPRRVGLLRVVAFSGSQTLGELGVRVS